MRPLRGIAFKLGSVLIFILMSALVKTTSDRVPGGEAVFFRSFFAIPVIVAWLAMRGELRTGFYTANPMGHVWRGFAGTMAMGLGFAGLAYLPFPEVTAIGYAAPLLTVIFAAMFLGENVRLFRISMVLTGLVGVLIVIWPRLTVLRGDVPGGGTGAGTHAEAFGAVIVLTGAVFAALAQVFIRKLVATEKTATIVFWFSVTATCLSLFTIPFGWVWPTPREAATLTLAGLMGGVGQILLTSAYREADASLVAPFDYASMIFALAIGWFVFQEMPTWTMLTGAVLIILAGIMIIWRERRLGLERARQRKATTPQG
ncbi:DMT family transporter [Pseudogemmobacter bohemicus]|uniref:DMT family transporter n=1 Tax=Pseudogemmobacter bohemicus TaxID=2250708 RepID=UPI000DD41B9D|nr:DMT family transporter [Pseudogemmobacter bohemicus]